ncbi:MAG: type II toxin-antitoxin system RatA family toxin [Ghiorsea sp.]|nr:type II toxin-antitoxin system RatA family toxin [Ghiorsea sp.]
MHCFEETKILPASAKVMYDLVMDIEAYPAFVPWVCGAELLEVKDNELSAELTMDLAGMKHKFQTVDYFMPHKLIEIRLLSGPFKFLESVWTFEYIDENSCEVHFSIEFEFKNMMLDMVASPLFGVACKTMVKTFEKRAASLAKLRS